MRALFTTLLLCTALFAAEKTAHIAIEGMTCPLCTTAIKKSLKSVKGVTKVKVKLSSKDAVVTGDEKMEEKALLDAIERVGYKGTILSFE